MAKLTFTRLRDDEYPDEEVDQWGYVPRKYDNFKSSYHDTLDTLRYELECIDVYHAVLEIDFVASDFNRCTGSIRPNARELSPRVRLTFSHLELGPLQYPCGTYRRFHANIRAIALTLEAQRAIERYGATKHDQQKPPKAAG